MFEYFLANNVVLIVSGGVLFAVVGWIARKIDPQNPAPLLVMSDGFLGASIATLIFVSIMIFHMDDKRAVEALKQQEATIALFSILGGLQFVLQFLRSLR